MSTDTIVMIGCACASFFLLGMEISKHEPEIKKCPVVEGQKVLSTAHDGNGHYCTYSRADGYAKYKRKL